MGRSFEIVAASESATVRLIMVATLFGYNLRSLLGRVSLADGQQICARQRAYLLWRRFAEATDVRCQTSSSEKTEM